MLDDLDVMDDFPSLPLVIQNCEKYFIVHLQCANMQLFSETSAAARDDQP